jgi:tRNA1Val (adenine37-N6)-methyltransferase
MSSLTHDSISLRGAGVITIDQPARGHRFTLDSILLADFCRIRKNDRVLEPGAGTGIVSILLAKKFSSPEITAVELQSPLVALCRKNVSDNALDHRITVIERDITELGPMLPAGRFDVIVANPPYTKVGAGRRSPVRVRRTARQDRPAGTGSWLDLQMLLKNGGRYFLVFPVARLVELVSLLRDRRLEPKRLRMVHPYQDRPASLVLIEAVKSGGAGIEILPPLVVHENGGGYSEEMREIYAL